MFLNYKNIILIFTTTAPLPPGTPSPNNYSWEPAGLKINQSQTPKRSRLPKIPIGRLAHLALQDPALPPPQILPALHWPVQIPVASALWLAEQSQFSYKGEETVFFYFLILHSKNETYPSESIQWSIKSINSQTSTHRILGSTLRKSDWHVLEPF